MIDAVAWRDGRIHKRIHRKRIHNKRRGEMPGPRNATQTCEGQS